MRFSAVLLTGAFAALTAAQDPDNIVDIVRDIPPCATACYILDTAGDCSVINFRCQCPILAQVQQRNMRCLQDLCTADEIAKTKELSNEICDILGVIPSEELPSGGSQGGSGSGSDDKSGEDDNTSDDDDGDGDDSESGGFVSSSAGEAQSTAVPTNQEAAAETTTGGAGAATTTSPSNTQETGKNAAGVLGTNLALLGVSALLGALAAC